MHTDLQTYNLGMWVGQESNLQPFFSVVQDDSPTILAIQPGLFYIFLDYLLSDSLMFFILCLIKILFRYNSKF